jgi:hypothetical protein
MDPNPYIFGQVAINKKQNKEHLQGAPTVYLGRDEDGRTKTPETSRDGG